MEFQNQRWFDQRPRYDRTTAADMAIGDARFCQNQSYNATHLRNIMNGVHGDCSVSVDKAKKVGEKVLSSVTGESRTRMHVQTK